MSKATFATAFGIATLCLASLSHAQTTTPVQPTGSTGVTAFDPAGAGKAEAKANTTSTTDQAGNAGMQQPAKPGFDNKPPKGAKADCHRPQGGVDASGGENLTTTGKHNTSCTGSGGKDSKGDKVGKGDKGSNGDQAAKPAKG